MIYNISSKHNQNLKTIRQLKRKNARTEEKKFIAEGKKIVLEAFENIPERIFCLTVSESFAKADPDIIKKADELCGRVFVVPEGIFNELSDTETPQGVLAVVNICEEQTLPDQSCSKLVVLDGVSEPGNLGTVIRTAEALGFDGIYLTKGCADTYSPKTVRSTMGSLFRMRFKANCTVCDLEELQQKGFALIATTPGGDTVLEKFSPPPKFAVVIGNEAHGVSDEVLGISDFKVKITMEGRAESLNAAVAAGIAMHWLTNA